jgi:predicted secreted protein
MRREIPGVFTGGRRVRVWRSGWRAFFAIAIAVFTSAQAPTQDTEQQMTVLHVSQTAERSVVRDVLRIELRVEETGADARSVQAAINRRMAAALDRVRQVQGVRVETGSYNVGEERPQNGPLRWRGSQTVVLTGKNADAILKLAGALQSDGLSTSSLSYDTAPETVRGAEEDLTAEALAALDHRAASIADRMHLTVVRFRDVRVGNAENGGRPVPRFAAMAMAAPVAEPGEAMVRVTIEAELLLAPPRP